MKVLTIMLLALWIAAVFAKGTSAPPPIPNPAVRAALVTYNAHRLAGEPHDPVPAGSYQVPPHPEQDLDTIISKTLRSEHSLWTSPSSLHWPE